MMQVREDNESSGMRLDKWLWCARFFKTRGLAAEAIKGGKILVNDERPKPSRTIQPATRLLIKRTPYQFEITVTRLTRARVSSKDVATLYTETAESIKQREVLAAQIKLDAELHPHTHGRPTKRTRRDLIRFKSGF